MRLFVRWGGVRFLRQFIALSPFPPSPPTSFLFKEIFFSSVVSPCLADVPAFTSVGGFDRHPSSFARTMWLPFFCGECPACPWISYGESCFFFFFLFFSDYCLAFFLVVCALHLSGPRPLFVFSAGPSGSARPLYCCFLFLAAVLSLTPPSLPLYTTMLSVPRYFSLFFLAGPLNPC